jgi:hypothetical protein
VKNLTYHPVQKVTANYEGQRIPIIGVIRIVGIVLIGQAEAGTIAFSLTIGSVDSSGLTKIQEALRKPPLRNWLNKPLRSPIEC